MRKINPGGSPSKSGFGFGLKPVNPPLPPGMEACPNSSPDNQQLNLLRRGGGGGKGAKSPDQDSLGHDSITTSDSVSSSVHNGGIGGVGHNHSHSSSASSGSSSFHKSSFRHQQLQHQSRHSGSNHDSICSTGNVEDLIKCGMPDVEVLQIWLGELGFDEYFPLFSSSGYDMPTITRMTPEDLTAIGIQNPNHRKRLKSEIHKLNIADGVPNYIPASLEEWLFLLRLTEYRELLFAQGYTTLQSATRITVEDLEDVGIFKLGHQKRFLLGLKRIKELRVSSATSGHQQQQQHQQQLQQQQHWASTSVLHEPTVSVPPPMPSAPVASSSAGQSAAGYHYQPDVVQILRPMPPRPSPPAAPLGGQQPPPPPQTQQMQQLQRHQLHVTASLEQLPPPPSNMMSLDPRLNQYQVHPTPSPPPPSSGHHHPYSSYDDTFVHFNGYSNEAPVGPVSTFAVHSNSAQQWGTLPRAPKVHNGKPVAKVPAYPRPPQPPQVPPSFFEDKLKKTQGDAIVVVEAGVTTTAVAAEVETASCASSQGQATTATDSSLEKDPAAAASTAAATPKTKPPPPARSQSQLQKFRRSPGESLSADDVLDDIGTMLADLTDELDAMLHSEKS